MTPDPFARVRRRALAVLVLAGLLTPMLPVPPVAAITTFTVTTTADSGAGSLRQAITDANSSVNAGGRDEITFDIGADGSSQSIVVTGSPLPDITEAVSIDATTQAGALAYGGVPLITIDGTGVVGSGPGFKVSHPSGAVDIVGFTIVNFSDGLASFSDSGIWVTSSATTRIRGNYIGTDGTDALPNEWGVYAAGTGTIVGGAEPADRNVISGNSVPVNCCAAGFGIRLVGNGNIVQGNLIGTDPTGTAQIANSSGGIDIASSGNLIGGDTSADPDLANVISGNGTAGGGTGQGIYVQLSSASSNTIRGNLIGTNLAGTVALSSGANRQPRGIRVLGGNANVIRDNTISGNGTGIQILPNGAATDLTEIRDNLIGTNGSGNAPVPNTGNGIEIQAVGSDDVADTVIDGNTISGNGNHGVFLNNNNDAAGVTGTDITSNAIGTNAGDADLGNAGDGIRIGGGSNGGNDLNVIGGLGTGNTIAYNDLAGVFIANAVDAVNRRNTISANAIYANDALEVDLAPSGRNANDAGDGDGGANDRLNWPEITATDALAESVTFDIDTDKANEIVTIELFKASSCAVVADPQADAFVGSQAASLDANGDLNQSFVFTSGFVAGEKLTATITDSSGNTSELGDCVTATDQIVSGVDMAATKSGPGAVNAGEDIEYTVTASNIGTGAASSVVLADVLPPDLQGPEVCHVVSIGDCTNETGFDPYTGSIAVGSVPEGDSESYVVRATVDPDTPGGTVLSNSATVSSAAAPDANTGNDTSASVDTTVTSAALITVVVGAPAAPVYPGDAITYTFDIANTGPSSAQNVFLSSVIPPDVAVTMVDDQGNDGCTTPSGYVECSYATLAPGASVMVSVTGDVSTGAPAGMMTFDADVSWDNPSSTTSGSDVASITHRADLSANFTSEPASATVGEDVSYTVELANAGPQDATGATASIQHDPSFVFVSGTSSPGCSSAGPTEVSCTLPTLGASTSRTVTFTAGATGPFLVTATAVAGAQEDPAAANDTDTASTTVLAAPQTNLGIDVTDDPDPVVAGEDIAYTVTVENFDADDDAPSTGLTATLDADLAGAEFCIDTGSACTPDTPLSDPIALGTLAPDDVATVRIIATVDPSATGSISSDFSATSGAPEPADDSMHPNDANETTAVDTEADLTVTQSVPGPDGFAGDQITFDVSVENAGPSDSDEVGLVVTLPVGTTFVSASGTCDPPSGSDLTCSLGALAASGAPSVTSVTVQTTDAGVISNTVAVSSATTDPNLADNTDTTTITVYGAPGFAQEGSIAMPAGADGASFAATGTFDAGSTVDVAVTNPLSGDVSIFLNDGDGGLTPASEATIDVGGTPRQIVAANVDGGAGPDLMVNTGGAGCAAQRRCIVLLSSNGDGTFDMSTTVEAVDQPEGLVLVDVDEDGNLDLVLANSKASGGRSDLSVFLGDGQGGFDGGSTFGNDGGYVGVDVADLSGDGNPDVILAGGDHVTVYLGDGAGDFTLKSETSVSTAATEDPYPIAGDFDGDGYTDVAVNGSVHVLFGRGNGEFRSERTDLLTGESTVYLAVLDVNRDGSDDIVAARKAPVPQGEPSLRGFFGRGDGNFDPGDEAFLRFPATDSIATADLDGDGKKDLIIPNGIANKLTVLISNGVPAIQTPVLVTDESTSTAGAAVIDSDTIDLLTLGLGDGALAGAAGPEAAPIGKNPIGKNPIGKNPIGKNPIGKNPIGKNGLDVPSQFSGVELSDLIDSPIPHAPLLSEMVLNVTGGWRSVLAPDDARPLQEISLNDVIGRQQVRDIDLSTLDYSGSILDSLPPVALLAGSTPLADMPPPSAITWASLLSTMGGACADFDDTATLVHLALERCDLSLVPWSEMPLTSMDLSGSVLEDFGTAGFDTRRVARPSGAPAFLSGITLDQTPAGLVDCTLFDCQSDTDTLADVENTGTTQDPYGFELDATFGLYLHAANASALLDGITFEDFVLGVVEPEAFPYELASVTDLLAATPASPDGAVTYRASAVVACTAIPDVTFSVQLPDARWRFVESSAVYTLGGDGYDPVATVEAEDPTELGRGRLEFAYPPNPCTGTGDTADVELAFDVQPAPAIGTFEAGFTAHAAGGVNATAPGGSPVTLTEANTPNDDPATSPELAAGNLYFSQFSGAGDVNYFRIPVTHEDVGSLMVATISNFEGDVDAVLYGSPDAFPSLRSAAISNFDAGAAGLGDQEGCLPNGYVVEPTSTEGVPLLDPQGFVPRGYSTNRSNQAEIVCSVVQEGDLTQETDGTHPGKDSGVLTLQILRRSGDSTGPVLTRFRFDEQLRTSGCVSPALDAVDISDIHDALPASLAGVSTYYLINEQRIAGLYGRPALTTLLTKLDQLVAATDGAIVPVERNATVAAAYGALDDAPCSPDARNRVVASINALVDSLRTTARPEHVVLVGGDSVVPFAAKLDRTGLGNQVGYAMELRVGGDDTPISRAFARGLILTDDPYGSFEPESYLGDAVYLPAAGIGRLVETPSEIGAQIDAFLASDGQLDPSTALVTGADFSKDVGRKIRDVFDGEAGVVSVNDVLAPAPSDPGDWTADDLDCELGNGEPGCPTGAAGSPGLISINGHFSHYATEAGDGDSLYLTSDFTGTQVPPGALLFTIGCNSGVSVDDYFDQAGGPETLDWAQALAQRQGVLIANNGFGYGDTNAIAYSERLSLEFSRRIFDRHADGSAFTVGQALALAKTDVYAGTGTFTPYDVKSLEIATLFGLPMYKVVEDGDEVTPPEITTVTDPDTGLQALDRSIGDFVQNTRDRVTVARGEFFRVDPAGAPGTGPVLVSDGNPYQPRSETLDVTVPGLQAHGALLTDLNIDLDLEAEAFDPVYSTTLLDGGDRFLEPTIVDVTFPNEFGAVANTDTVLGARSSLVMYGGRFTSDPFAFDGTGTQRIHNSQSMRVYYSTSPDFNGPQVGVVQAVDLGNNLAAFTVTSLSTDVAAAYVTYRRGGSEDFHTFRLTPAGTQRWSGTVQMPPPGVAEFIVQLVDHAGNVRVWQNKGVPLALVSQQAPPPGVYVSITGGTPVVGGWYSGPVQVGLAGGFQTFQTSVDGGPFQLYGGPVNVTAPPVLDGMHTLAWAGSYGTSGTEYIPIDANPPSIAMNVTDPRYDDQVTTWIGPGSTVTVDVTDQGSGVGSCTIAITPPIAGAPGTCGGGQQVVSFAGAAEGEYSITVEAVDNVGHEAAPTTRTVIYDTHAPDIVESVTTGPNHTNGGGALYVTSATDLDVSVTDPPAGSADGSGVAECTIAVTGAQPDPACDGGQNLVELSPRSAFPDGVYTVATSAEDNLGQASSSTYPVRLDNTAPILGNCPTLAVPESASLVSGIAGSSTARTLAVNELATPPRTPFQITIDAETMTVTNRVLVKNTTTRYTYTVMRGASPQAHLAGAGVAWPLEVRRDLLGRLASGVNAPATGISVTGERYGLPSVPFTVQIDGERMRVDSTSGTAWTVTRGVDGTTPAVHGSGAPITWVDVLQAVYVDVDDPHLALSLAATDPDVAAGVPGSGVVPPGQTQPWNLQVQTSVLTQDLPVSQVGTYRLRYQAVDRLGNATVKDCWYEVIYRLTGFYKPIELDKVNVASAGQAVGVKWTITDADGVPFTNPSTFVAVTSSSAISGACTNTPQFAVTDEFFKGGSNLQNLGGGSYQYNWAVPKNYGGSCRTMGLRLTGPGLAPPPAGELASRRYQWANFQFKTK